jgi:hypothetical protein
MIGSPIAEASGHLLALYRIVLPVRRWWTMGVVVDGARSNRDTSTSVRFPQGS